MSTQLSELSERQKSQGGAPSWVNHHDIFLSRQDVLSVENPTETCVYTDSTGESTEGGGGVLTWNHSKRVFYLDVKESEGGGGGGGGVAGSGESILSLFVVTKS